MDTSNPELLNGPLYLGSLFAVGLFACFLLQTVLYFNVRDRSDKWPLMAVVGWVLCTEIVGVSLMIHQIYGVLAKTSLGPTPTFTFPSTGTVSPLFSCLTTISVQLFFAWRIYILAKTQSKFAWPRFVPFVIFLLTLGQLGSVLVIMYRSTAARKDRRLFKNNREVVRTRLVCVLACDLLMSATFTALLYPHRKSVKRSSRTLVNALIRNTLENGAITTIPALCQLIFNQLRPGDFIHFAFTYITARMHANVLLSSLNARRRLRRSSNATTSFTITGDSTSLEVRQASKRDNGKMDRPQGGAIATKVTTVTTRARRHSISFFQRSEATTDSELTGDVQLTTVSLSYGECSRDSGDKSLAHQTSMMSMGTSRSQVDSKRSELESGGS